MLLNGWIVRWQDFNAETRVIHETRVQRVKSEEEPLVKNMNKLTLQDMGNKEVAVPDELTRKLSRSSTIDSAPDVTPYQTLAARSSVERQVASSPPVKESQVDSQETKAVEKKQSGFKQKFFGCFSFAAKSQETQQEPSAQESGQRRCRT